MREGPLRENMTAKQEKTISTILGALIVAVIGVLLYGVINMRRELADYKQAYKIATDVQHTVILQMDESCYEQFENNYGKALYIKMRIGEGVSE